MSNYMIMIISRRHLSNNIWFWRFGYKRAKLALRIRIIKALCEAQFDLNARFKLNINKLEAGTLRLQPVRHILKRMIWKFFLINRLDVFLLLQLQIGKDKLGNCYWFQVDPEANVRVYREDLDDETWELVASNRFFFCNFIYDLIRSSSSLVLMN